MTTLQRMNNRRHWTDDTVARWKREREERDRQRVRDHYAKLLATTGPLFQRALPDDAADRVLARVSGELAHYRIISHHCVLCGRKLTTDEGVRLTMGPECFERFAEGGAL